MWGDMSLILDWIWIYRAGGPQSGWGEYCANWIFLVAGSDSRSFSVDFLTGIFLCWKPGQGLSQPSCIRTVKEVEWCRLSFANSSIDLNINVVLKWLTGHGHYYGLWISVAQWFQLTGRCHYTRGNNPPLLDGFVICVRVFIVFAFCIFLKQMPKYLFLVGHPLFPVDNLTFDLFSTRPHSFVTFACYVREVK